MDIRARIEKAFQCKGWFDIEKMIWALINDDHEALAQFRLMKRKLEAEKSAVLAELDLAKDENERHAILASIKAPMSAKIVSDRERDEEVAVIKAQRKEAMG